MPKSKAKRGKSRLDSRAEISDEDEDVRYSLPQTDTKSKPSKRPERRESRVEIEEEDDDILYRLPQADSYQSLPTESHEQRGASTSYSTFQRQSTSQFPGRRLQFDDQ